MEERVRRGCTRRVGGGYLGKEGGREGREEGSGEGQV